MMEAKTLINLLNERNMWMATAESCTGGNIAHEITLVPGASSVMKGGVVSYSNEVKMRLLKVPQSDLREYGAVSRPVVEQMARGVCETIGADLGIATSGIAGPGGGTPAKPVGTVWIAAYLAPEDRMISIVKHFTGDRVRVIEQATGTALQQALRLLD